ncbi:hypothetical protein [Streptomyces tendae]
MTLAASATTMLVGEMTRDGWNRTKQAVAALWRRTRPEQVAHVESELDITRDDLVAARANRDGDTEAELVAEWQGRLRRLLSQDSESVEELRRLLTSTGASSQHVADFGGAVHLGFGDINQAGRDMTIHRAAPVVPGRDASGPPEATGPGPA